MLKFLEKPELIDLYNNGEVRIELKTIRNRNSYTQYNIKYLEKKYFSISNGQHYYYFYDMYNFLDTSLNNASKNFLQNEEKITGIDAEQINKSLRYWDNNFEKIKKYCIQDAVLTQKLADVFWVY
jgi:hypothetical protein